MKKTIFTWVSRLVSRSFIRINLNKKIEFFSQTYVSNVLIAINPYKNINGLYSQGKIESYRADSKYQLPPHLYAIANRIIRNINQKKPQSILLTGETGSGKTKSINHLLSFLCHSSFSNEVRNKAAATSIVFEQFGNAQTSFNKNSSRFTKLTEVIISMCPI